MLGLGALVLGVALAISGTKDLIADIDCKSTPYRTTRDGKPVSVTRKGDDYINGESCMSIPYTSEYGATYWKTIGRRTGRVYEDTRDTVTDRWEREARKSYEENKAKGKLGYLRMNFRLHYCLLTEMSTGKQIAALGRYSKDYCYKEYLDPNGSFCFSGDGNKIQISNEEYEGLSGIGGMHTNYDALKRYHR